MSPGHVRSPARSRMVVRAIWILRTLETSAIGWTADELANTLEVHRRTIYRDLAALQEAHVPMVVEAARWRVIKPRLQLAAQQVAR